MIYAKILAAVALLAALYWGLAADYSAGKKSGEAAIQTQWDADKAKIQATADAAIAQATKERDTALEANEVAQNAYQTQLSLANASAATFAQRLRSAETSLAASRSSMSKGSGGSGSTATSQTSGDVNLTSAFGAALAECAANTAQLDALITELKPQLVR
jgi:hypothetical protein